MTKPNIQQKKTKSKVQEEDSEKLAEDKGRFASVPNEWIHDGRFARLNVSALHLRVFFFLLARAQLPSEKRSVRFSSWRDLLQRLELKGGRYYEQMTDILAYWEKMRFLRVRHRIKGFGVTFEKSVYEESRPEKGRQWTKIYLDDIRVFKRSQPMMLYMILRAFDPGKKRRPIARLDWRTDVWMDKIGVSPVSPARFAEWMEQWTKTVGDVTGRQFQVTREGSRLAVVDTDRANTGSTKKDAKKAIPKKTPRRQKGDHEDHQGKIRVLDVKKGWMWVPESELKSDEDEEEAW